MFYKLYGNDIFITLYSDKKAYKVYWQIPPMIDGSKITTIKIDRETKLRLDKLKVHSKESYDEVIQKILFILNLCKVNPLQARDRLIAIDKLKRISELKLSDKTKTHF